MQRIGLLSIMLAAIGCFADLDNRGHDGHEAQAIFWGERKPTCPSCPDPQSDVGQTLYFAEGEVDLDLVSTTAQTVTTQCPPTVGPCSIGCTNWGVQTSTSITLQVDPWPCEGPQPCCDYSAVPPGTPLELWEGQLCHPLIPPAFMGDDTSTPCGLGSADNDPIPYGGCPDPGPPVFVFDIWAHCERSCTSPIAGCPDQ